MTIKFAEATEKKDFFSFESNFNSTLNQKKDELLAKVKERIAKEMFKEQNETPGNAEMKSYAFSNLDVKTNPAIEDGDDDDFMTADELDDYEEEIGNEFDSEIDEEVDLEEAKKLTDADWKKDSALVKSGKLSSKEKVNESQNLDEDWRQKHEQNKALVSRLNAKQKKEGTLNSFDRMRLNRAKSEINNVNKAMDNKKKSAAETNSNQDKKKEKLAKKLAKEETEIVFEDAFSVIQKIASSKKKGEITFSNGQSTDIDAADAKIIMDYIKKLSSDQQKKYKNMLDKNSKSFLMAVNLAMK